MSVKDDEGNTINEPDRSNPTRYRFERPLDTIRSFNAAAEGTSHRRSSYNSYNSRPGMLFHSVPPNSTLIHLSVSVRFRDRSR